jgi:hypothetical protein
MGHPVHMTKRLDGIRTLKRERKRERLNAQLFFPCHLQQRRS